MPVTAVWFRQLNLKKGARVMGADNIYCSDKGQVGTGKSAEFGTGRRQNREHTS